MKTWLPIWQTITQNRNVISTAVLSTLVLVVLLLFAVPISKNFQGDPLPDVFTAGKRNPSGVAMPQHLDQGWKLAPKPRTDPNYWVEMDLDRVDQKEIEPSGEYWMQTEFTLDASFREPALILGSFPSRHRVYVNGIWVGGTEKQSLVPIYSIDSKILKYGSMNTILVKAYSKDRPQKSLKSSKNVGIQIGEFSHLYPIIHQNLVPVHFGQIALLTFTFLISTLSAIFFIINPSAKEFLYYALLGLSALMIQLHQTSILTDALASKTLAMLKTIPIFLIGPILASAFSTKDKRPAAESRHNWASITGTLTIALLALSSNDSIELRNRLDFVYGFSLIYSAILGFRLIRLELGRLSGINLLLNSLYALVSISKISELKTGTEVESILDSIFVLGPALMTSAFIAESLSRKLAGESLDSVNIPVGEIIASKASTHEKVKTLHHAICEKLKVSRSTLYAAHDSKAGTLIAESVIAENGVKPLVNSELPLDDGIIGYSYSRKSPVLVQDMQNDLRFSNIVKNRDSNSTYPTGSCIVIPLLVNERFVGFLTLTEKRDRSKFNLNDFKKIQLLSTDLALLLANQILELERFAS